MRLDHLSKTKRWELKEIKQKSTKLDNERNWRIKNMIQTQTYLKVADNSGAKRNHVYSYTRWQSQIC